MFKAQQTPEDYGIRDQGEPAANPARLGRPAPALDRQREKLERANQIRATLGEPPLEWIEDVRKVRGRRKKRVQTAEEAKP